MTRFVVDRVLMQMLGLGTLLYLSLEHFYSAQYCNMAGGEREERSKGQKQSGADGRTKTIDPAKPEKYTATVSCFRLSSLFARSTRNSDLWPRRPRHRSLRTSRTRPFFKHGKRSSKAQPEGLVRQQTSQFHYHILFSFYL